MMIWIDILVCLYVGGFSLWCLVVWIEWILLIWYVYIFNFDLVCEMVWYEEEVG